MRLNTRQIVLLTFTLAWALCALSAGSYLITQFDEGDPRSDQDKLNEKDLLAFENPPCVINKNHLEVKDMEFNCTGIPYENATKFYKEWLSDVPNAGTEVGNLLGGLLTIIFGGAFATAGLCLTTFLGCGNGDTCGPRENVEPDAELGNAPPPATETADDATTTEGAPKPLIEFDLNELVASTTLLTPTSPAIVSDDTAKETTSQLSTQTEKASDGLLSQDGLTEQEAASEATSSRPIMRDIFPLPQGESSSNAPVVEIVIGR